MRHHAIEDHPFRETATRIATSGLTVWAILVATMAMVG